MPQILPSLDEYASQIRKKDTVYIVFNTVYNDVHAFNKKLNDDEQLNYLNKKFTDTKAQKEFLEFMRTTLPNVKIQKVFDLVSVRYLEYPYLGSYAIDVDIGTKEYKELANKYNDPYKDAVNNSAVLWIVEIEDANVLYSKRKEFLDAEFSDED